MEGQVSLQTRLLGQKGEGEGLKVEGPQQDRVQGGDEVPQGQDASIRRAGDGAGGDGWLSANIPIVLSV